MIGNSDVIGYLLLVSSQVSNVARNLMCIGKIVKMLYRFSN